MTPAARRLARQLVTVWLTVALVEFLLWWFLWRGSYTRPLFETPALLVGIGGVLATLGALRQRRGADRRDRAERRR